jgi:inorganic pyrophosphatase
MITDFNIQVSTIEMHTLVVKTQTPIISTQSLRLAQNFIGKKVAVTIDRCIGSKHPKYGYTYTVNYGYIAGVKAPDHEELDAYYLGTKEPLEHAVGFCIAVVHRKDDDDDKLVVVPIGVQLTDQEIIEATKFQEQWFDCEIIRKYTKSHKLIKNEKKQ